MCDVDPNAPVPKPQGTKPKKRATSLMLKDIATAGLNELRLLKTKALDRINNLSIVKTCKIYYYERPDLGFLVVLLSACLFALLVYKLKGLLFPDKPKYTKSQLKAASLLAINDFTIDEVAVADLEAEGLREFNKTFTRAPYSPENSGAHDLQVSILTLPLVMFVIMYVLPVIAVMYTAWFIWNYWRFVMNAAWGFWLMMYHYFDAKVTGSLGCKWYIKMATGWGCHTPDFMGDYFDPWRREFIDRPIYLQSLTYLEMYIKARQEYYVIPKEKYITVPWDKFKVKLKYLKKVYIDRTMDIFLRKFKEKYPQQYDLPRNEFYHWLLNDKKAAATLYARRRRAEFEFEGLTAKERF
jgi:hypothetical protein